LMQGLKMRNHLLCLWRALRSDLVSLQCLSLLLCLKMVVCHTLPVPVPFWRKQFMSLVVAMKTRQSGERR
jgi:hypothetical protein